MSIVGGDIDLGRLDELLEKIAEFDVFCLAEFSNPLDMVTDHSADLFSTHAEIIDLLKDIGEMQSFQCMDQDTIFRLSSTDIGSDEAVTLRWRDALLTLRDCVLVTGEGLLLPLGLKFEIQRMGVLTAYLHTGEIA